MNKTCIYIEYFVASRPKQQQKHNMRAPTFKYKLSSVRVRLNPGH